MTTTIYHNPDCGTSRNTLALLRHFGVDPHVVEYRKTPPTRQELAAILAKAGLRPRDGVRKKGTPYAELGLDAAGDEALPAIRQTRQARSLCPASAVLLSKAIGF